MGVARTRLQPTARPRPRALVSQSALLPHTGLLPQPDPLRPTALPQPAAVQDQRELVCSVIGLTVKLGLVIVAGVSLARLASAYQERMERQGELAAVLDLENAKLAKARERFDHLFMVEGEQRLIREQSQWIAPNRLRVVWQSNP